MTMFEGIGSGRNILMKHSVLTTGPVPPLFGISLVDQARALAIVVRNHIIVIEGIMSGDIGMPEFLRDFQNDLQLKIHGMITSPISVGVYELFNDKRLSEITSLLEDNGGFKLVVIDQLGQEIPAYTI